VSAHEQDIINLGMALSEPQFRKDFADDPEGTLSKRGINIPGDVLGALKKHRKNLDALSDVKESLSKHGFKDEATAQMV
jgi:hypothetical protein